MDSRPQITHGSEAYTGASSGPVVTIGNFDGVHRGHRTLLGATCDRARQLGVPAVVYTFDPAPRDVLRPDNGIPRIQTLADKAARLGEVGIDHMVVEPFSSGIISSGSVLFLPAEKNIEFLPIECDKLILFQAFCNL